MTPRTTTLWLTRGGALAALASTGFIIIGLWPELGWDRIEPLVIPTGGGGATPSARMGTAVGGCIAIGLAVLAVLLAPLVGTPAARPAGRALSVGLLTWWVLDAAVSISFGGWLNVASNTVYLLLILPAALSMWRSSHSPEKSH